MNRIIIYSLMLLICPVLLFAQTFTFEPVKPVQGENIKVKFNPAGTAIENVDKVELYAYFYDKDITDAKSYEMKREGYFWTTNLTTTEKDLGVLIIFKSDDITENNNKSGYVIHLYKNGELLPGSLAGLGYAYYSWTSWYLDFDRNLMLANELFNREFTNNPDLKIEYVKYYVPVASSLNRERSQEIIKEGAQFLEKKTVLTDDDYLTLYEFYSRLNDSAKANYYEKAAVEKYPDGQVAQLKTASEINKLVEEDKIQAIKAYAKKYPESRYLASMHNAVIKELLQKDETEKLKNFLTENKSDIDPYFFQNSVIQLINKKADPQTLLSISSAGLEALKDDLKNEKKPEYLTETEWLKGKDERMGQALYTNGRVLYESGKISESLEYFQDAAQNLNYEETETNLYLAKALTDLGKHEEAFKMISRFIKEGNSSEEMNELLKNNYNKVKGTDEDFEEYLAGLEKTANEKLASKLKREIINETAPDFKLVNLEGNEFSLEQFRGKIVVIDFWATWCGPCKSSFPGLKKIVEKYSGNESVNFLFINSWERVENKKENAQKFISDNGYPFNVLLDLDNTVIEKYKVSGIPTKFIIDKKGNIRFKSVGYSGDNNKMVAELNAMISILNQN